MQRSSQLAEHPAEPRRITFTGDRFYTAARVLIVLLLFVCSRLVTTTEPIWPPFQLASKLNLVIWSYAVFALIVPFVIWLRPTALTRTVAFALDISFISLLTYRSHEAAGLLYPLYLVPLIGAAIQVHRRSGFWVYCYAALAYALAYTLGGAGPEDFRTPGGLLGLMGLILQALALVFVPLIASQLAERTVAVNHEQVASAYRDSQRATSEANTYREQMRSLYEVAYTLSTTMNYQTVLDTALAESRRLMSYHAGAVLLSSGQPDELYIAAADGVAEQDLSKKLDVHNGLIHDVLRTGDPQLINDISRVPELQNVAALRSCVSLCLVPLRAALKTYGVMVIGSRTPGAFTQDHLGMVVALANYAIVALHNAQLIHDLREERTKLISKEEEVRHQLARDLHDGPAQAMAAIAMNVEFLKRLVERDPKRLMGELDKMGALAKKTTYEVRTMLFELRPLVLETQGLDVTLKQYFERFQDAKTRIALETDNVTVALDTKTEGTLFNIIQESVNNALKHAQAKQITVRVKQTPTTIETTIQDDGKGFDLAKVKASYESRGSFGLLNIEERAKLIGGFAELSSASGQGTSVRIVVPIVA